MAAEQIRRPRSHWALLGLLLLTVAAALAVTGYVSHEIGASGTTPANQQVGFGSVPESVLDGGPVLTAGQAEGRRLPARTVALTFDDGPDPRWTPQILSVLERRHVPATFFVVGSRVDEHPELVRRAVAGGSEIGLHTYTHGDIGRLSTWRRALEVDLTQHALAHAGGVTSTLLRPPYSSRPDAVDDIEWPALRWAQQRNLTPVLSDLDSEDWRRPGFDQIIRNATPSGSAGGVVLLHDGGGDRSQTAAALDALIDSLQRRGYRFTTVTGALGAGAANVPAAPRERAVGTAQALVVSGARATTGVIEVLMVVAGLLSVARTVVMAALSRRHVRRTRRRSLPTNPDLTVSVIVPAYNEEVGIAAAVRSLVASSHPSLEIVVVDDGSTDGTSAVVEGLGLPNVRLVRQSNAGKPAALATGIAHSSGDVLVLVDGDTVFEPDTVSRLIAPFADPSIGAVAGNTKVGNRRRLLGRWQHLEYVIGFNLDRRLYEELNCMPTVPGAVGAFRRDALDAAGGMPGDTLAEDTDVTMAVLRAGWRVVYAEDARAWTEAPATLRQLWLQRYRWCYGTLQAMWKHRAALIEPGAGGKLGRRGLPYLLLFQVALPLFAPVVDVFAVYGLVFLDPGRIAAVWIGFLALQMLLAGYALRLDGERLRTLWVLPIQQLVYRQLMYLVVIHSAVTALTGARLRWHKLARSGLDTVPASAEVIARPVA